MPASTTGDGEMLTTTVLFCDPLRDGVANMIGEGDFLLRPGRHVGSRTGDSRIRVGARLSVLGFRLDGTDGDCAVSNGRWYFECLAIVGTRFGLSG